MLFIYKNNSGNLLKLLNINYGASKIVLMYRTTVKLSHKRKERKVFEIYFMITFLLRVLIFG